MTGPPGGSTNPWQRAVLPVAAGRRPRGERSLAEMTAAAVEAAVSPERHWSDTRTSMLLHLHDVLFVLAEVVVTPFVVEGECVQPGAHQLGIVREGDARAGSWCSAPAGSVAGAARAAATIRALLDPVVGATSRHARLGRRGLETVAADSLTSACRRLERVVPDEAVSWRVDCLLLEIGSGVATQARFLEVRPDDGPGVRLPLPRICCVLAGSLGADSCPGCPRHPDDAARRAASEEWLRGLDDESFAAVVGRPRHEP